MLSLEMFISILERSPLQSYLIPYGRSFSEAPWSINSQISALRIPTLRGRTYAEERPLKHIIWISQKWQRYKDLIPRMKERGMMWHELENLFPLQHETKIRRDTMPDFLYMFLQRARSFHQFVRPLRIKPLTLVYLTESQLKYKSHWDCIGFRLLSFSEPLL